MSKCKQKRNNYNDKAIKALVKKYGVTAQYIRQSLRGDRTSITSDKITSDYKSLCRQIDSITEKFIKE
ncbi:hypothetical protein [Ornithobacterium rhinotracheale]|uniref:hypothetical protein n=1 Tax=Ornithobacterium rhinotracheale TaxID=28251 RepID=UPI001FF54D7D|nr:hypothetical protein [Ornithobacterium rhinotracheale]MCK0206182.1 hypothetical protein [Ornithobacterium rhinotracheale]